MFFNLKKCQRLIKNQLKLLDNAPDAGAENQKSWIPVCQAGIFMASATLKGKLTEQTGAFQLEKLFPHKDNFIKLTLVNLFVLVSGDEKQDIRMT